MTATDSTAPERPAAAYSPARPNLLPRALSDTELALFRGAGERRRTGARETIFRRGEIGRSMFVIDSGRVQLEFGDGLADKLVGPREYFGELALFIGNHARLASATAAEESVLYVISHAAFEQLLGAEPTLLARFMLRSFSYLVSSEQQLIGSLRRRNEDLMIALDTLRQTQSELTTVEQLTRTDELTGLANRRGLYQFLEREFRQPALGHPGVLLIDVDRFKQLNDGHGHLAGDAVLQAVAAEVRAAAGATDLPCRLGGDEFALLTHAVDAGELTNRALEIVENVRRLRFAGPEESIRVTVSVGACLCPGGGSWPAWYSRADTALYQAKGNGGDGWKLCD
ncbi:MAG TPA: GGDEF domain-containing protein [Xanthomonadaceae bacterium]|nr:GGDEF domain-containing protein [Xanthomonadaceae bacterium]